MFMVFHETNLNREGGLGQSGAKIADGLLPFFQLHVRPPAQIFLGEGNVRFSLDRGVLGQGLF